MKERRKTVREYFEDTSNEKKKQKRIKEFAEFLDDLYRNHHNYLDRLGMAGITKLAEVIVIYSDRVIEELQKY